MDNLAIHDHLAIRELSARYNVASDDGDGSAFAATFTPDGILEMNGTIVCDGEDALTAFASKPRGTVHYTTDAIIEVTGSSAVQRCGLLLLRRSRDGTSVRIEATGRYRDELEQAGGQWRFKRRAVTLDTFLEGGSTS